MPQRLSMIRAAVSLCFWLLALSSFQSSAVFAASMPESADEEAVLLLAQGRKLVKVGRAGEALPFFEQTVDMVEARLGQGSAQLATLLHELATVYRDAGRPDRAEIEMRRALAMMQRALGPEHQDILPLVSDLAHLLAEQDRYAEAENHYRRALQLLEDQRQEGDPDVIATLGRLALLADIQDRNDQAQILYRQAIDLADQGRQESPELADAIHNLASIYHRKGQTEDAEPLFRRGLDLRRRLLGAHHWVVAVSQSDLAALLYERQDLAEAGVLAEAQALADRAQALLEPYCGALNTETEGVQRSAREVCRDNKTLQQRMARPVNSVGSASRPSVPEPSPESVRVQVGEPAQIQAKDSVYRVQLAARQDRDEAQEELQKIRRRHPRLLGRLPGHLETVDLGFKGIWHRLQFGAFATYDKARALCDALQDAGLSDCWISNP